MTPEPTFTNLPSFTPGHINSGAPDYIKLTLVALGVQVDGSGVQNIWTGSKEITVDGTSAIDVSDIKPSSVPTGKITAVVATFNSLAKIKGTLTAGFNDGPQIYSTKAAYPYNAVTHTGGTDLASSYAGAAEETDFYINADSDTLMVSTPSTTTIDASSPIKITILFDINRLLRFYNGTGSGVNPTDPIHKAYFFGHSLLGSWIATFFGDPGKIEGYATRYSVTATPNPGYGLVKGWMTVVYDSNGKFLSGLLMGDDDNALTCAKGWITSYTDNGTTADFSYDTSNITVSGFERVKTQDYWSPNATVTSSANATGAIFSGEAHFQLEFAQ